MKRVYKKGDVVVIKPYKGFDETMHYEKAIPLMEKDSNIAGKIGLVVCNGEDPAVKYYDHYGDVDDWFIDSIHLEKIGVL